MATTLYATFGDAEGAERATGALLDYGVKAEDITLVRQKPAENQTTEVTTSRADDHCYDNLATGNEEFDIEKEAKEGITTTTPEDAEAGAIKGAGVGLSVGAVAALASMFIPGLGLIVGGGTLAIALAGVAGSTGAGMIAGAMVGYMKDQGMDNETAHQYAEAISLGKALLSVSVPSGMVDESTVRSILDKYGATHVTNLAATGSGGYVA